MVEPTFHFIELAHVPILEQLQLEEALMRVDDRAWCLINRGSPPAIVMGISGKPEELVHLHKLEKHPLPLIRRFSGGGCVVVDENTLFITFIGPKKALPCHPFPQPIMQWTADIFYRPLLHHLNFQLQCNDYALGSRKFGGNAQYLQKERFLHHSTLLYDYDPSLMACLKMPAKIPDYRASRSHADFLCCLKEHFPTPQDFLNKFQQNLSEKLDLRTSNLSETLSLKNHPHRKATQKICASPPLSC